MASNFGPGTFRKGVHPNEAKELTESIAIEVFPTPAELRIPMDQHIGVPCKPCVKAKETVTFGQQIGAVERGLAAPIFASLPGTIKRIGAATHSFGHRSVSVTISVNREIFSSEELFDSFCSRPTYDIHRISEDEIREKILAAGVVGQGGAAFPTAVKLTRNPNKPIDTLLVNGCECEPYLTADHRCMLEMSWHVLAGAKLAAKAVGAKRILICIEDNKPFAIQRMNEVIDEDKGDKVDIAVMVLKTKYPQGGEKQLIYAALGRKVPIGALPMDVGTTVVNIGTTISITRAVLFDEPVTHRVVTITGGGVVRPSNLFVPIGALIHEVIAHCGGLNDKAVRVISGGPMMGCAIGGLDIPVTKGTSGITVLSAEEVNRAKETNCVKCGRCVSVCPMGLIPTRIALAVRAKNWELMEKYHPMACIECGCCSFACPAGLPLVHLIRVGKAELKRKKSKK